ncbi:MAG: EFR1 family ferrodoxin, partial [Victivallaceae bacterium]
TLIELKLLLKAKGLHLACGFCLVMPPNYLPFGGPGLLEKQQKHFTRSEQRLKEIAEMVGQMKHGRIEKTPCVPHFFSALVHKLFLMRMSKDASKFQVNVRCNSCGICSRVCPSGNIELANDGKPTWGNNCEQCMACIQWCPQKAIQIRGVSENCPHYHHPDVSVNDIFVR